jgi:hypothetical protein
MSGYGTFTWPDGRRYEGEYQNDKKHGFGVYIWPNGRSYQGNWENGKQHGVGTIIYNTGEKKHGIWINGKQRRKLSTEKPESNLETIDEDNSV